MIRAVIESRSDIDHGITGQVAARHRLSDPLLYRWDIIARDRAADDFVDEFKTGAMRQRLNFDPGIAKLAVAAGLFFLSALGAGAAANGFFVRHLGRFKHDLGAILCVSTSRRRFQHAADPCRIIIKSRVSSSRCSSMVWIFFASCDASPLGSFSSSALLFGSKANEMLGVKCTGPSYWIGAFSSHKRIAGGDVLELGDGDDLTGQSFLDRLPAFCLRGEIYDRPFREFAGSAHRPSCRSGDFPESTRIIDSLPANGSITVLNT